MAKKFVNSLFVCMAIVAAAFLLLAVYHASGMHSFVVQWFSGSAAGRFIAMLPCLFCLFLSLLAAGALHYLRVHRTLARLRAAETQLHEQARHFRLLYEESPVAYLALDDTGRILDVNAAWSALLGYDKGHVTGHLFGEYLSPDSRLLFEQQFLHFKETGVMHGERLDLIASSGGTVHAMVDGRVAGRATFAFPRMHFVLRDVTAQVREEQALAETEKRIEDIASSIPGAIYQALDVPGEPYRITYMSGSAEGLFGHPLHELMTLEVLDTLLYPDDQGAFWDALAAVSGKVDANFSYPFRIVLPDGSLRWLRIMARSQARPGGGVVWNGVLLDITELKHIDETMRKNETRLRTIINSALEAIIAIDDEGLVTLFNPAAEAMFQRTRSEMLGKPLDALLPEAFRETHSANVRSFFATGSPDQAIGKIHELQGQRADGTLFPLEISLSPGETSGSRFVIAVVRDITAQKQAEEERRQFERRMEESRKHDTLGVLASGIAHDFNNILAVIMGHSDLALDEERLPHQTRESLEAIKKASRRAADIVSQIVSYAGKGNFVLRDMDAGPLFEGVLKLFSVSLPRHITLESTIASPLPPIHADANQVRQIAINLVQNAIEALEDTGGTISVSLEAVSCDAELLARAVAYEEQAPGDYLRLTVADSGPGIPPEVMERLFDPFFSTKFPGRGLGLPAVLGTVRTHGGCVCVGKAPGGGACFEVYLPVVEQPIVEEAADEPTSGEWRSAATILLVDDDESYRHAAKRIFERLGMTVLVARDGVEALEIYRRQVEKIDCIVLDLLMPRMDGMKTYAQLMELGARVPVVISSGCDDASTAAAFAGKDVTIIGKPYERTQLQAMLMKLLAKRD